MNLRISLPALFFFVFLLFPCVEVFSQCLQIETILVDSCDSSGDEGFNEMTRFRTEAAPLNVGIMTVNWPGGTGAPSWQGLAQDAFTASKVATLNAQIAALGGCGRLREPIAGVIPANTEVILITSQNFSLTANAFGALIQDIYILFQDNTTVTTGHFGNYGATSGIRTLKISFGAACSDTVSYDRSLLVNASGLPGAANGATVNFTPAGVASYTNGGCVAPIEVFSADAGNTVSACPGTTITLAGTALGQSSVSWSAPSGTFSNSAALNSSFTLPFSASGSIVLTLTATNACGNSIIDTVTITVSPSTAPNFSATLALCSGSVAPALNTTSPNGIAGVWSPTVIDNLLGGNYVFTPNAGQCATNFTLAVTINPITTPDFSTTLTLCSGTTAPALNAASPNGITGAWSPNVINNTVGGNYVFTPNTGQCASNVTFVVTVTSATIVPDFSPTLTLCSGTTAPALNATSPNGITGVWSPNVINNTAGGNYTFTPNTGQCASNVTLVVTVTSATIVPDFSPTLTLCSGTTAPALNATSPNGISGVWSPNVINNTAGGNYTFTPNAGQCASNVTLVVTVTSATIVPSFAPTLTLCSGNAAPALNTTSPNGITGVWSPTVISNTLGGNYVFTPNAGQCATSFTLTVTVTTGNIIPNFATTLSLCSGTVAPPLNTTSLNGITGVWSPTVINNSVGGNYTFTPNAGQCAITASLAVTITAPNIVPTFNPVSAICVGGTLSPLPTTSLNGITGTWSPALDYTQTKTYFFTPNSGQCAVNTQLIITVNPPSIVPTFATTTLTICNGDALSPLPTTSLNGIIGIWSPALDNLRSKTYNFLPNAGQCALGTTFTINVTPKTIPTFNPVNSICAGETLTPLPTTSLNGITGTWSPALDNTQTRIYTFQPDPNQCAATGNLTISVTSAILPVFNAVTPVCVGTILNPLPSTSLNSITGTWSPAFDNMTSQLYTFTPNPGQCATNGSLNITVAPNPIFTETAYICFDAAGQVINPATIDSGLSIADYSFTWTQDGNPLTDITASIQASQTGIYEVTATNRITNCTITINTTVLASTPATAFAYVNEDFAELQQIIVEVSGGLGDFLYQLDHGPFQPSNVFIITKGGDYTIHVKDVSGCNTFELKVTALNFPKFFTPNDDGYNDYWNVAGLEPSQDGQITIFDRYGKLLKQFAAIGEGWNGTFNGKALPATDYWFVISYKSLTGASKNFRSHFTLKR